MTMLILVILNSSSGSITTNSINFSSEVACLNALGKVLEMEKKSTVQIKARCVKYEL
jgi:hypothetical protein